ncbi:MAG: hypothetical protein ACE5HW_00200 [Candidatus Methanofastidiosia archaeon]
MGKIMPSSKELIKRTLAKNPKAELNQLHEETYKLMLKIEKKYYESKVDDFLRKQEIDEEIRIKLKKAMLIPIIVEGVEYSNFMEEASRRISQTYQVISGNVAELIAERELKLVGLKKDKHYVKKKERTDLIVYHPNMELAYAKHRVEVKNVKLRERATRGLAFDGDSLFGFFDTPKEFTESNVDTIDKLCRKSNGYCYIPPLTLGKLTYKGKRIRSNSQFGKDMKCFIEEGVID